MKLIRKYLKILKYYSKFLARDNNANNCLVVIYKS